MKTLTLCQGDNRGYHNFMAQLVAEFRKQRCNVLKFDGKNNYITVNNDVMIAGTNQVGIDTILLQFKLVIPRFLFSSIWWAALFWKQPSLNSMTSAPK